MYKESVGVLGGFGGYATLEFYKNFLKVFASDSERNYPHIIIDNDFTMPSRTRALLYDECYDEIVDMMTASMKRLIHEYKVSYIILVCGTAHYFLKDIYNRIPEAKGKVLDIIEVAGGNIDNDNVFIIAAEGALKKKLYENRLSEMGISCVSPLENEWNKIREFIEAVKKGTVNKNVIDDFYRFIANRGTNSVILGCTEFSALVDYCYHYGSKEQIKCFDNYKFIDPVKDVLNELKKIIR